MFSKRTFNSTANQPTRIKNPHLHQNPPFKTCIFANRKTSQKTLQNLFDQLQAMGRGRSTMRGHAVGRLAGIRSPINDGEEAEDERKEDQRALVDGAARRAAKRDAIFGDGTRLFRVFSVDARRLRVVCLVVGERIAALRGWTHSAVALVLGAAQEGPVPRRHGQKETPAARRSFLLERDVLLDLIQYGWCADQQVVDFGG
jgi:hypothetical protein